MPNRGERRFRIDLDLVVVILSFVISYFAFLYNCYAALSYYHAVPVPRIWDMISLLLGCINLTYNPISYRFMKINLSKAFVELFCLVSLGREQVSISLGMKKSAIAYNPILGELSID